MGAISKISKGAAEQAIEFVKNIARITGQTEEQVRQSVGNYPEKIASESTTFLPRQEPISMYEAMKRAEAGASDLVVMDPEKFIQLSPTMNIDDYTAMKEQRQTIAYLLDLIEEGVPLRSLPELNYGVGKNVKITGSDGRHRNRALLELGEGKSLIELIPDEVVQSASGYSEVLPPRIKDLDPSLKVYSQPADLDYIQDILDLYDPEELKSIPVGALGDLMKVLGIGGIAATGALEGVGQNAQVQETTQN